ncbi:hypothetical protein NKG94_44305 [Micromonospora sp. M12]
MDIQARIKRLARQYRDLVDVIDLPNKTQGYRRTAAGYLGDPAVSAVVVESVRFGDQSMNGVQVRTVDPGRPNRPLTVGYRDRVLTVSLATDTAGKTVSTTDEVAAAINARQPNRFRAVVEDGSAGCRCPSPAHPTRRRSTGHRGAGAAVDRAGATPRRAPGRLPGRGARVLAGTRPGVGHAAGDAGVRRADAGQRPDRPGNP